MQGRAAGSVCIDCRKSSYQYVTSVRFVFKQTLFQMPLFDQSRRFRRNIVLIGTNAFQIAPFTHAWRIGGTLLHNAAIPWNEDSIYQHWYQIPGNSYQVCSNSADVRWMNTLQTATLGCGLRAYHRHCSTRCEVLRKQFKMSFIVSARKETGQCKWERRSEQVGQRSTAQ